MRALKIIKRARKINRKKINSERQFNFQVSVRKNCKRIWKKKERKFSLLNLCQPVLFLWWIFAGHCTGLLWLSSVLATAGASNLSLRWVNTSISTDIDRQYYYNTPLWFIKECMKIAKVFGRILSNSDERTIAHGERDSRDDVFQIFFFSNYDCIYPCSAI